MNGEKQKSNPSLANAVAVAIGAVGIWWGITLPSPVLGVPVSLGSYAALDVHRRKYGYKVQNVLGECLEASTPMLEATAESLKANQPGEESGPITKFGYTLLMKLIGERSPDEFEWFNLMQFGLGSAGLMPYGVWLVAGEQREGKSMAARHLFARYLEQHPGCQVLICDVELESHPKGYWFGMDDGAIASTPDEVVQAFQSVRKYLSTAKGDGNDPGLVVMFDELKSTFNSLSNKQRQYVIDTLQDIHSKGAKRKVLCINIMHTLTGGVLQWPGITDFAPKCNMLMLQRFANDDSNFNNLQSSEALENARSELAAYKTVPLASEEPRPCLLYTDKQWSVRWIPTMEDPKLIVTDEAEPIAIDDDPYCNIREFIDEVEFPFEELSLNRILEICGVTSSAHKSKDGKFLPQWQAFRNAHNARVKAELD